MLSDYIQLTKPRIVLLILMSTMMGFYFGVSDGGWHLLLLLHTFLGTGLIAGGTMALNQWWEREADSKMERTKFRPLPGNRIGAAPALSFALVVSAVGFAELWFGVNRLAFMLGLLTLTSYVLIYTPLKSRSSHATTIGAIPGALPPLIGFAASHGSLTVEGWVLFSILFLWQFPHFYAIAWMYREDYSNAGMKMLPVIDVNGELTVRRILFYSLALIPISLLPSYLGMSGKLYFLGALLLGVMYFYSGVLIARNRTRVEARRVLLASIVYLPVLYGLMIVDRAF